MIPTAVNYSDFISLMETEGLRHRSSGKTREMFDIPGHPRLMLIYATDRISIFDIVLNALVPYKGEVLSAMTIMWLTEVFSDIESHLVAYGRGIDKYLPQAIRGNADLQKRAIIVSLQKIFPIEAIVRGYLTGSGWGSYKKNMTVCGISLPAGLVDGSRMPEDMFPLFTPSTKAEMGGKDENITVERMTEIVGVEEGERIIKSAVELYSRADRHASERGIILADTKFEFGRVLSDELLTPDSSRYWKKEDQERTVEENKKLPLEKMRSVPSFDKEPVRQWGKKAGIKEDHSLVPPDELIAETSTRYLDILEILFNRTLGDFQVQNVDA